MSRRYRQRAERILSAVAGTIAGSTLRSAPDLTPEPTMGHHLGHHPIDAGASADADLNGW